MRVTTYIDSWIRKQLLISQAMKTIDINEAEVERKVLEYRYPLIRYEYQNFYINKNLNGTVSAEDPKVLHRPYRQLYPEAKYR